jgi:hypothetical protein
MRLRTVAAAALTVGALVAGCSSGGADDAGSAATSTTTITTEPTPPPPTVTEAHVALAQGLLESSQVVAEAPGLVESDYATGAGFGVFTEAELRPEGATHELAPFLDATTVVSRQWSSPDAAGEAAEPGSSDVVTVIQIVAAFPDEATASAVTGHLEASAGGALQLVDDGDGLALYELVPPGSEDQATRSWLAVGQMGPTLSVLQLVVDGSVDESQVVRTLAQAAVAALA